MTREEKNAILEAKAVRKTSDYRTIVLTPGWAIKSYKNFAFFKLVFVPAEENAEGR